MGFWGYPGDDQHVLMVRNVDGLDEGPHEELVWHGGETFLLSLLVRSLEVRDVLLHAGILLLGHLHEGADVFTHVRQVVLLEFRIKECHQSVVAGEGIGWDGWPSGLASGGGNSFLTELFIEVDLEDFVSDARGIFRRQTSESNQGCPVFLLLFCQSCPCF